LCFSLTSYFILLVSADIINFCVFGSLVDSPTRRVDPLLHSYSDYEDSVYGNHCNFHVFPCILSYTKADWLSLDLKALLGAIVSLGSLRHYPMMGG
jgi:hypothetical protein